MQTGAGDYMLSMLRLQPVRARVLPKCLDRNRLFAALIVIGFANGVVLRIAEGFRDREFTDLAMNTFDISAIVWIALIVGIAFVLRSAVQSVTTSDQVVAAAAAAAFLVPVAPVSWIALSGLAVHMAITSSEGSFARRGAWILLALTVPMLWSRVAFQLFSDPILAFDATLVGWLVGTEQVGNTIAFSDGSGYLWVAPGCSSLTNVSLAILCWVLFKQVLYRERAFGENWWCILACAAVVAINVTRLSLIAFDHPYHEMVHGVVGATVANWVTLLAIVGICALGVRDAIPARH
jgi:hypothetical protein